MLLKTSLAILPAIFLLCWHPNAHGNKCEMFGLVDNRMQCILHDRGTRKQNLSSIKNQTIESPKWLQTMVKGVDEEITPCGEALDCNSSFYKVDDFKQYVRESIEATRWCSDPEVTRRERSKSSSCCRNHERCEMTIEANETKHGLTNLALYNRSHCDCDRGFYDCLKEVNNVLSKEIGYTYFTVLQPQCFKLEHPVVVCRRRVLGRCLEYKHDHSQPKKYQWFDNPLY